MKKKPFIIAEMSGNHNQSIERALKIVDEAAKCGVDAIKLQTYTKDTMTMKGLVVIKHENQDWNDKDLYDLYGEAYTPWEWHKQIFERAKENGILCFSSPFDETAVDFLETLSCPIYKIASFENTHYPLLQKVAETGKPIIMSTGVANLEDIIKSVKFLVQHGAQDISLLKCTSTYPASSINSNLLTIPLLKELFPDCQIGLSDHTMGIGVSIASVALGASVIEKHFTLSRADGGVDSAFSMEPSEMSQLVIEANQAFLALGAPQFNIQDAEKDSVMYKRSIYISKEIKKGEVLTSENLKIIRPGFGLAPSEYYNILGKEVTEDLIIGTPLTWGKIRN